VIAGYRTSRDRMEHLMARAALWATPVWLPCMALGFAVVSQEEEAVNVRVEVDGIEAAPLGFRAVDAQLDPDRALMLADGSALYPLGSGAPQVWAWCQTPTAEALDVRGAVLGWYGAHALG
jgi:hypothetical protein